MAAIMDTHTPHPSRPPTRLSVGLSALARRSWEPLSVVIALLSFVVIVAMILTRIIGGTSGDECDFCPLELAALEVSPNPLVIGEPAVFVDGLCNRSNKTVSAQVELRLEPQASALNTGLQPLDLINSMRNIGPGECLADRPIMVETVSENLPTGTWRLAVRIVARGRDGRMQIIPQTSEYFDIVRRP